MIVGSHSCPRSISSLQDDSGGVSANIWVANSAGVMNGWQSNRTPATEAVRRARPCGSRGRTASHSADPCGGFGSVRSTAAILLDDAVRHPIDHGAGVGVLSQTVL